MADVDSTRRPVHGLVPIEGAVEITKSDDAVFDATRGIYVAITGDLCVDMLAGQKAVTFCAVMGGQILWIRCTRVYATGTTARGIIALY
jgi:hypothetical protein